MMRIPIGTLTSTVALAAALHCAVATSAAGDDARRFPGASWPEAQPADVQLDQGSLEAISEYLGGRGCVVRHGLMVYHWGDITEAGDIASAAKPWFSTFLFKAVETGLLPSVDARVVEYEPRLAEINEKLGFKDRGITFAHMANQTSCYGVAGLPGTAFDYNDWQMALFVDTLFLKVYKLEWERVDTELLHKELTDILQCEDEPSFLGFGLGERAGRMAVSPRDFARFGWMYLNEGRWKDRQVLSVEHARQATRSPLPATLPRTQGIEAAMMEGQRTLGSQKVPDNQTDHHGSYSWLWWVNGVEQDGSRYWPDAPLDVFAALGHKNGQRGMAAIPSLDLVISWNDTTLGDRPTNPHPLNEMFRLLVGAVEDGF
jgi:CubicO group peptidase (beta-lactamase class C family)